ncbi:MAG: sulfotransferase family 2 domain-containing protein [Pseudomonadota bacterium]
MVDKNWSSVPERAYRLINRGYRKAKAEVTGADMQVIFSERAGFAYVPVPKVANSTIKRALLDWMDPVAASRAEQRGHVEIHDYFRFRPSFLITEDRFKAMNVYKFAVVRDPVSRFVSAYTNRIHDHRDLETTPTDILMLEEAGLPLKPDLNTFALNIQPYCAACVSIKMHLNPQINVLRDPALYDRIYSVGELDQLRADLIKTCGVTLDFGRSNPSSMKKPQLSADALQTVLRYYAPDYQAFPRLLKGLTSSDAKTASPARKAAG